MLDKTYMDDMDKHGDVIASNIAAIIEAKGRNVSEVAKAMGLGHTTIRDIVKRKARNPRYLTLVKLANELGVDVQEITIGPNAAAVPDAARELIDVWLRLSPEVRQFLLTSAQAQLPDEKNSQD